jgi:Cu2+-exporting ATPase
MAKLYRFILSDVKESKSKQIEDSFQDIKGFKRASADVASKVKSVSILVAEGVEVEEELTNKVCAFYGQDSKLLKPIETLPLSDEISARKKLKQQNSDEDCACDDEAEEHDHHSHPEDKTQAESHAHKHPKHGHHHHHHHHNHWLKALIGIVWGLGLLVVSMLNLNIPQIALYCMIGATALTTFYLGSSIYLSAIRALTKRTKLTMNTLYTLSTLAVVGVSKV